MCQSPIRYSAAASPYEEGNRIRLTRFCRQIPQIPTKFVPDRVSQQWGVWTETALWHPCYVAVFALEETDEQCEVEIDAPTSVAGFQLSFVGGALELLDFGVGLDLDGALDLFEHYCEDEHDAEGGKPG